MKLSELIKIITLTVITIVMSDKVASQPIKVACVGNSVTFGARIENPSDRYPSQLQDMLGNEYEVKNFGRSGATLLKNGYRPYWSLPEFEEALNFKADIVIIHLGLNDTDPRAWPKYRDEFVRDYSNLIDTFRSVNPDAEVIICRLTPIFSGHTRFQSSTRDWYWQVQDAIEVVAEVNSVELLNLHSPLHRRPDLFPDYLHPNGEGAKIIAEVVHGAITGDYGGLKPASIFKNGMVLQRDKPIKIWGTANRGETVSINLSNKENNILNKIALVDRSGNWLIEFPPLDAGDSYTLEVSNGENTFIFNDILIGDVWLCSGQSNMEFKLQNAATAKEDIPKANFSRIRLFNMQPIAYTSNEIWNNEILEKVNRLQYYSETEWQYTTPETAKNFSAVAYHFGKTIHQETDVPIGLILNAVGGSPAEAWIDRYTLEYHSRLVNMFSNWSNNDFINPWCRERATENIGLTENTTQRHPYHPSYLYESGIQELTNLNIAGVIWYQGESNEHNVELHEVIFSTLVESWRNAWNEELPFYYVQLSSMAVGRETWGHFRDSQRRLMFEIPNTGMAVSSDLGDSTDVHPRNKKEIGERLALWALNKTYGLNHVTPSGPLFHDLYLKDGNAYLSFEFADGLKTSDDKPLRTFEVAEFPGLYFPATAVIEENVIKVTSEEVIDPKYVRYGWSSYSNGNLVNKDGLPASTFSTQYYK